MAIAPAATRERIVIILRDSQGRIKKIAGKHIPLAIRIEASIDAIRRKLNI